MLIPSWKNLLSLRNFLIQKVPSTAAATTAASSTSPTTTLRASFHSTPVLSEKRKKKSNADGKVSQRERPSKNYIRYTVREKRADAKKALNNLFFHTGGIRNPFQDESDFVDPKMDKPAKKFQSGCGRKPRNKKTKRWHRQGSLSDDFDTETTFEATFANKWYSWSFKEGSRSRNSTAGVEWREGWSWTNQKKKSWDDESDDEFLTVGSRSDRTILGLPPTGPLKIQDVKNAFREVALKWHPDKHQGASQATAEEKFKLCVNAYKSLCSALA